jgi:hypothetical protein
MSITANLDQAALAAFCRCHRIARLGMFGSRARGTARDDSDVDLLVTFEDGHTPGLEFFGLADALARILGHRVDLLTRATVEQDRNPYFRQNVLSAVVPLYAA